MYNLRKEPFSTKGSYMAISYLDKNEFKRFNEEEGLYLRSLHTFSKASTIFRIDFLKDGVILDYTYEMTPTELTIITAEGEIKMCYPSKDELQIKGKGIDIQFHAVEYNLIDHLHKVKDGSVEFNSFENGLKINARAVIGVCDISFDWDGWFCTNIKIFSKLDDNAEFEMTLTEYDSTFVLPDSELDYDSCKAVVDEEFSAYLARYTQGVIDEEALAGIEKAAYINWSSVVSVGGHITRPGMLMSKNWMNKIWAWDHCFNAMILMYDDPDFAWDQMMVVFDNQHVDGSLPDVISDGYISRTYYKLPIHGYVLKQMMAIRNIDSYLEEIYEPLIKWTNWWLNHRHDDNTGLCYYFHNNESGWDNGSVFNDGGDVITPELNAFIILQLESLSEIALRLGKEEEAAVWMEKMTQHKAAFDKYHLFDNEILPVRIEGMTPVVSSSLMPLESIILGDKLSEATQNITIDKLKKHITDYGLVTELLDSECYVGHYWRGPIWAPSTYLVVSGLKQIGDMATAYEIVKRYVKNAIKNGFGENYSAKTGESLCDGAYTWTSSVFLLFVKQWKERLREDNIL